jgi:hypothetical protein
MPVWHFAAYRYAAKFVAFWHIASFRTQALKGRYWTTADKSGFWVALAESQMTHSDIGCSVISARHSREHGHKFHSDD